jgi:hypothetical protein
MGLFSLLASSTTGAGKQQPGWTLGTGNKQDTERANQEVSSQASSPSLPQTARPEASRTDDVSQLPAWEKDHAPAELPVAGGAAVSDPFAYAEFLQGAALQPSLQRAEENEQNLLPSKPLAPQSPVSGGTEGRPWVDSLAAVLFLPPACLYLWAECSDRKEDPRKQRPV